MANSCIVCGQAAGSGEHVFPAALGGRRTNKNIYCTKHDNSYSSLVAVLANQVDVFNALLGVIPDHSTDVKSVVGQEISTGEELRLSVKASSFTTPRVLSRETAEHGELINMAFPTHEAMQEWIAEQKAKGLAVMPLEKPRLERYFINDFHLQRRFGGVCGLGAVAYVTQTFLAQAFPELARSGNVAQFIAYTQAIAAVAQLPGGCDEPTGSPPPPKFEAARQTLDEALKPWNGQAPVWWDFNSQPDATPNAFDFGHRVTVGVDATDGQIFGRFSLFSSIHFSMRFGTASAGVLTKTVTVDIDPMAAHPPSDIKRVEAPTAIARVEVPEQPTAGLHAAIVNKSQEEAFTQLMRKIEAHSLAKTAAKMHTALAAYPTLPEFEGELLVNRVIDEQAQRVLNITRWVIRNFDMSLPEDVRSTLSPILHSVLADDPNSVNGLTPMANAFLALAMSSLASQIRIDIKADRLNQRRIAELLGEGPGATVVGSAVLGALLNGLQQ